MNTITRLLATVSVLAIVSACGSDTGSDDGADTSAQDGSSTAADAPTAGADVVSVSFRRSGGLKPIAVNRTFTADEAPPKGYDAADVTAVIDAATALTDADVQLEPLPENTCCDRYTYAVTVTYADGSSESFTSIDGVGQPKLFTELLSAVS